MGKHSAKKSAQIISAALQQAGINQVVISPGSRNAPLIIELTNRPAFSNYSVIDERVAGFFALGMAQQIKKPVVLVCTSGSALLNYYPAVAEAFYSKIPLVVISADRPQKWVDQGEGQTIRQHEVFKNHSWYNTTLSENEDEKAIHENISAVNLALQTAIEKQGPVHINVPFDEPLYELVDTEDISVPSIQPDTEPQIYEETFLDTFARQWNQSRRKMILVGQHAPSEFLQLQLEKFIQDPSVIVLHENISNVHHVDFIGQIDQAIFSLSDDQLAELAPEILITVGRNIVSKKVKQFLRKYKPKAHWHVEQTSLPPDTFKALTQHFDTTPEMFFSQFLFLVQANQSSDFQKKWHTIKQRHAQNHQKFIANAPYSDLKVFDTIIRAIPDNYMIHWGNSSTIRYAQLFDYKPAQVHYGNRGTSGIDGSTSTGIGAAFAGQLPALMISGDISFLYDSNALWNKYIPNNFKLIVINNGGGDIFNFIPGPSRTQALNEFFVTKHNLNTQKQAEMFGFKYYQVQNLADLEAYLPNFFSQNNQPQLLEIVTREVDNAGVLKAYFKTIFSV